MQSDPARLERLDPADWRLLAVCAVVLVGSLIFSLTFFDRAFPEASIDFRYGRGSSERLAVDLLTKVGLSPESRMHAAKFEVDDPAKIFLERSLGLKQANALMGDEVEVWTWTHRWFRPLETEKMVVRISPRGEIVGFEHQVEETWPATPVEPSLRVPIATRFLESIGVDTSSLRLVSISDRSLPNRVDTTLVWEHRTVRPRNAAYQYEVTLHGAVVGGFRQSLQVPENWRREYTSLRAKNETASDAAAILLFITTIAALFVFVVRIRRRDIQLRYSAWIGGICALLITLVSLNAIPSALADYDTRTSFSSFLFQEIGFALLGGISLGLFLMVMVGTGDALLRERLPDKLAMPLLFSKKGFRSKRVFTGSVIGFTLVGGFLAYQVGFYLIAERFGAWAPAEIPYDETLNTLLPWAVVLFGGFFPAFSEEYISRAFSIPFLERLLRWRFAAIAISAMIWGFGHSAYPNQPFFIRGLEVGIAGVALGYVVYRFGLLPALVWHYTVDALYTALLLMQSGNTYYVVSSAICTFIFAIPLILSGILYFRHGGFEPDGDLENRVIGTSMPDKQAETIETSELPPEPLFSGRLATIGVVAAAVSLLLWTWLPPKLDSLADYPIAPDEAVEIGTRYLRFDQSTRPEKVVAYPSAGFRSWEEGEKGGSPGSYDSVAAEHIAREVRNPFETLRRIMSEDIEAATWKVRFFTPGATEEFEVEIHSRTGHVVGETHRIEEDAPGAVLERDAASEIAATALHRSGFDIDAFELKEAIAVPMPDRRDWVFQFERRQPIANEAWMRVVVRLGGNHIAHIGKTIRIPENVRREAGESRLINSLLFFGQIAGAIFMLVVVGAGAVIALRERTLRWKPALRFTALLAIPAAIAGMLRLSLVARDYRTSISWDTFIWRQLLLTLESVAFQLFLLFLSIIVIAACQPWAMDILSRAGRSRFGRDAVVRGLIGAVCIYTIFLAGDALELWSRVGLDVFSPVSDRGAIPFPALAVFWRAISTAAWVAALAVAGRTFVNSLDSANRRRLTETAIVIALAIFLADSSARIADLPVVFLDSLITALLLWLVARYIFAPNPLSVLLMTIVFTSSDDIASWIRSGRGDLEVNALILGVMIVATFAWMLSGRVRSDQLAT